MISLEKWMILTPLQKLTKNVEDLGKLIVANGLKMLPKVQKIAQSGHTGGDGRNRLKANSTKRVKDTNELYKPNNFSSMGRLRPLFVYFHSFQTSFLHKKL